MGHIYTALMFGKAVLGYYFHVAEVKPKTRCNTGFIQVFCAVSSLCLNIGRLQGISHAQRATVPGQKWCSSLVVFYTISSFDFGLPFNGHSKGVLLHWASGGFCWCLPINRNMAMNFIRRAAEKRDELGPPQ